MSNRIRKLAWVTGCGRCVGVQVARGGASLPRPQPERLLPAHPLLPRQQQEIPLCTQLNSPTLYWFRVHRFGCCSSMVTKEKKGRKRSLFTQPHLFNGTLDGTVADPKLLFRIRRKFSIRVRIRIRIKLKASKNNDKFHQL